MDALVEPSGAIVNVVLASLGKTPTLPIQDEFKLLMQIVILRTPFQIQMVNSKCKSLSASLVKHLIHSSLQ